jgi:DNA-binding protein Fis
MNTTPQSLQEAGRIRMGAEAGTSESVRIAQEGRTIVGATAADGSGADIDSSVGLLEQLNMPPVPEHLRGMLEETSLEQLVFWKLQALFERLDDEIPANILKTVLSHVERPLFALVLKKTRGNQSKAATVLGCNRNTLHRKLKGFSIQPRDVRKVLKTRNRRSIADLLNELTD